jgi:hypothetical protein
VQGPNAFGEPVGEGLVGDGAGLPRFTIVPPSGIVGTGPHAASRRRAEKRIRDMKDSGVRGAPPSCSGLAD